MSCSTVGQKSACHCLPWGILLTTVQFILQWHKSVSLCGLVNCKNVGTRPCLSDRKRPKPWILIFCHLYHNNLRFCPSLMCSCEIKCAINTSNSEAKKWDKDFSSSFSVLKSLNDAYAQFRLEYLMWSIFIRLLYHIFKWQNNSDFGQKLFPNQYNFLCDINGVESLSL